MASMRLDKYLSELGAGSRKDVKKMITSGLVTVNGVVVKIPETKVNEGSSIALQGQTMVYNEFEYYLLNKPSGFLTANSDARKPVVRTLIPSSRKDLSPVGRLDEDTEGVLLFTNDGQLAHELIGPKNHVKKVYYAELSSDLPENAKEILETPMDLGDFITKPAQFEKLSERSAYLTISEGKYHQVKRMFEKVGTEVVYLKRVSFGCLTLDGLSVGECRELTEEEIRSLKSNHS